jgi:hypothetical protein
MACIFIQNLINCDTEIELVKKLDQFGEQMVNFILIYSKFQVNHFLFNSLLKIIKFTGYNRI